MRLTSLAAFVTSGVLALVTSLATTESARADMMVAPGWDLLETLTPPTQFMGIPFRGDPLGSFNFGGSIGLQSLGNADTIVQRLAPATGPSETIPIELVALQLVSVNPINLGAGMAFHWITLQSARGGPGSPGHMTVNFGAEGAPHGTFDSFFDVFFDIHVGAPNGPIVLSNNLRLTSSGTPWQHDGTGSFRIPVVNYLLKGDGTINRDFFPVGPFTEQKPGVAEHGVQSSGPDAVVPEPASLALMAIGGLALVANRRRRFQWAA